ncbi:unnamed protein product [Rotaria sp. Silwood1]|nr:unnamed protein product [Rotaria sp. Silwood1]CAF1372231.1 unnamed protein product [Rotaria sp. Silwood1]CAF3574918.1 unnamed protein product [Rotaria sp. Silwood1]CAF3583143.1 unnamed protein product [Rotaria sp. Silwood1]CAF4828212.1 unnamed protein product [Rotaria sp. Silwood1]
MKRCAQDPSLIVVDVGAFVGDSETTVSNGTLYASTIRLDNVHWSPQSSILILKVDVEGFELNVLRSAEKLFRKKRIHHLIFEYTAWWTDRAPQKDLIPFVEKILDAKELFALDRSAYTVYGPLTRQAIDQFHDDHAEQHLQTDSYVIFVEPKEKSNLQVQPYQPKVSFA